MARFREIVLAFIILPLLLSGVFYSFYLVSLEVQKPWIYVIRVRSNTESDSMKTFRLANRLLYLNQSVFWIAEPMSIRIEGEEYTLSPGDFIVTYYQNLQSYSSSPSTISQSYLEGLFGEFDVSLIRVHDNIEAHVYPLKPVKIAVFYGGGVTGGALEHIHPLEDAGFDVGIIREENIRQGDLANYSIVTFPGGGPYDAYLDDVEKGSIKDFVRQGGGFLGTCGGSILGIKLGLLDAEVAVEGQYEANVDLRGPVVLNLTSSANPIVFGYSSFVESMYFYGPFITKVGNSVETVGSYYSKTDDLAVYFPEVARAYNYTPKTDIRDDFWGTLAIVSGEYGSGKVVLSTVHPEILTVSKRLFINSIFYLSSEDESLLKTSKSQLSSKTEKTDLTIENLDSTDETLWSQLRTSVSSLNDKASQAQEILTGLGLLNTQLVGISGEYLQLFLDDISDRTRELLARIEELQKAYEHLDSNKGIRNSTQTYSLGQLLTRQNLMHSIEILQARIGNLQLSMSNLSDLTSPLDAAKEELSDEKSLLQQIETEKLPTTQRFQQIINLHTAESLTLVKLKDRVDCYLLDWVFKAESILAEADVLNHFC